MCPWVHLGEKEGRGCQEEELLAGSSLYCMDLSSLAGNSQELHTQHNNITCTCIYIHVYAIIYNVMYM